MRPTNDEYFMVIARAVATRATCLRKHVGAVIVRDKTIVSTGYNGSIRGMPHCDDPGVGCLMEDGHCCRTVHAESNAILQAAKNGTAIDGATLFSTASPCWPCFGLVANAGIKRIVFGEAYRAEDPGPKRVAEVAKLAGIELVALLPASAPSFVPMPFKAQRLTEATATTRHAMPAVKSFSGPLCGYCEAPARYTCGCPLCKRKPDDEEKYHCCKMHETEVMEQHTRVRGRDADWRTRG